MYQVWAVQRVGEAIGYGAILLEPKRFQGAEAGRQQDGGVMTTHEERGGERTMGKGTVVSTARATGVAALRRSVTRGNPAASLRTGCAVILLALLCAPSVYAGFYHVSLGPSFTCQETVDEDGDGKVDYAYCGVGNPTYRPCPGHTWRLMTPEQVDVLNAHSPNTVTWKALNPKATFECLEP